MILILSSITFILIFLKILSFYYLNKNTTFSFAMYDSIIFIPKIFLQQISLFLFWTLLLKSYFNFSFQIIIISFIFPLCHFYLFYKLKKSDALIITIFSIIGAIIFVYLYTYYYYGIWIAFLIHLTFHIILDFIFIKLKLKPMKYRKNS